MADGRRAGAYRTIRGALRGTVMPCIGPFPRARQLALTFAELSLGVALSRARWPDVQMTADSDAVRRTARHSIAGTTRPQLASSSIVHSICWISASAGGSGGLTRDWFG